MPLNKETKPNQTKPNLIYVQNDVDEHYTKKKNNWYPNEISP